MRRDYAADLAEIEREHKTAQERTPKAYRLSGVATEILNETLDEVERHAIENVIFALDSMVRSGHDLTDDASNNLEARLRGGKVAR